MSTQRWATAWNDPIGRPNWWRSLACCTRQLEGPLRQRPRRRARSSHGGAVERRGRGPRARSPSPRRSAGAARELDARTAGRRRGPAWRLHRDPVRRRARRACSPSAVATTSDVGGRRPRHEELRAGRRGPPGTVGGPLVGHAGLERRRTCRRCRPRRGAGSHRSRCVVVTRRHDASTPAWSTRAATARPAPERLAHDASRRPDRHPRAALRRRSAGPPERRQLPPQLWVEPERRRATTRPGPRQRARRGSRRRGRRRREHALLGGER